MAVALAVAVVGLNTTAIGVATRGIADELDVPLATVSWIVAAYLVAAASVALIGGRLGDVIGRARTFVAGVLVFGLGSLLAAVAAGSGALIGARVVQGIGAALIMPASIELVVAHAPAAGPSAGFRMRGIVYASAFGVGPLLGGVVTDVWTWRVVFWIELVLTVVAGIIAYPLLDSPSDLPRARTRDVRGAVLVAVIVCLSVTWAFQVRSAGWRSWSTVAVLAVVAALAVLLIRVEHRSSDPLFHTNLLRDRLLLGANLAVLAASIGMIGLVYFFVLFAQSAASFESSAVGIAMALVPFTLSIVVFAQVAARLSRRFGYRGPVIVGLGLSTVGFAWLSLVSVTTTEAQVLLPLTLCGIGAGVANAGLTGPAVTSQPAIRIDEAAGITSLVRFFGSALAVAIGTSTYLAVALRLPDEPMAVVGRPAEEVALGANSFRAAVSTLRQDLRTPFEAAAKVQTVEAFAGTMRLAAIVIAVLTVASVWLFRSAHPDDDQPAADDTDPSRQ